jgi:hypothetical protein
MSNDARFLVSAYGIGQNLSPLVHSEEQLGNKIFFRRLSIKSGDQVVSVPVISGNSFRGAWRDLAALHLVDALNISHVSQLAFVTLFSGGALTSKVNESDTANALSQALYTHFPTLRLLGFSMGSRMFASRVGVDFAVPLTKETTAYACAGYPELQSELPPTSVMTSQITAMTMLTRKEDEEKAPLVDLTIAGADAVTNPTQMLFHVEYIAPNTTFVHGFRTVYPVSPLEFGALLKILELSSQRTYGGQGSRGFGRMEWQYTLSWRTSLSDPHPQVGRIRLGKQATFEGALGKFKADYETYVAGLVERVQAEPLLRNIIQFRAANGGSQDA